MRTGGLGRSGRLGRGLTCPVSPRRTTQPGRVPRPSGPVSPAPTTQPGRVPRLSGPVSPRPTTQPGRVPRPSGPVSPDPDHATGARAEALSDRGERTDKRRAEALPAQPAPTTHTRRPAHAGCLGTPSTHLLTVQRRVPRHAPRSPPRTRSRGACRGTDGTRRADRGTACRGTAGAAGIHPTEDDRLTPGASARPRYIHSPSCEECLGTHPGHHLGDATGARASSFGRRSSSSGGLRGRRPPRRRCPAGGRARGSRGRQVRR